VTEFFQYLVSGVALGAIYALVALGFVVIYRASQVFNFAHGEFLTFGALMMITFSTPPLEEDAGSMLGGPVYGGFGLPWGVSLVLALVCTGVLAAVVERVVLRKLVGRPVFVSIILTLFVGFILRTVMMLIWGTEPLPLFTPWEPTDALNLGGAVLDYGALASIGAGAIALGGFYLLMRFTKLGVAMRAAAADQETAMALGIPVGKLFAATWLVAGVYAALGGVFLGVRDPSVDMNLGFIALRAFPAVIVGGLESALGAVVAGLLLGVLEVLTAGYVNAALGDFGRNFHTVLPYLVMIAFLVFRPYGLFGQHKVERL
jgi:branched-chain amino acid transport system permease protein